MDKMRTGRGGIMARNVMGRIAVRDEEESSPYVSPFEQEAVQPRANTNTSTTAHPNVGAIQARGRGRGRGRGMSRGASHGNEDPGIPDSKQSSPGVGEDCREQRTGRGRGRREAGAGKAQGDTVSQLQDGMKELKVGPSSVEESSGHGRGRGKGKHNLSSSTVISENISGDNDSSAAQAQKPKGFQGASASKTSRDTHGVDSEGKASAQKDSTRKPRFDAKHASMKREKEEHELLENVGRAMQELGVCFRPNSTLMDLDKVEQLRKAGKLHIGPLRVNVKKPTEAFVTSPSFQKDMFIPAVSVRGTAFDQDLVAVAVLPRNPAQKEQEQGVVVAVVERKHKKRYLGRLLLDGVDGTEEELQFRANDGRLPVLVVAAKDCPPALLRHAEGAKQLLIAEVEGWEEGVARGRLVECVGMAGDLLAETNGLLVEHGIDKEPIPDHLLPDHLRDCVVHGVGAEEAARRRDCRGERVVSIDPTTAKDLDDALHVKVLAGAERAGKGEAVLEVGVHIADVSFFVRAGTELDQQAQRRATSTYLVQGCIPMLPHALCEDMCSLNPHCDRLAFSVIWRFDADGQVVSEWFGRTVIRNKCRLNYDTAQCIIDAAEASPPQPTPRFPPEYQPEGGQEEEAAVAADVLALHRLALSLRQRRFDGGALTINQGKIYFRLEEGVPVEVMESKQEAANRLVEELMLLANQSVARKVAGSSPELALLRNHPPPKAAGIAKLQDLCSSLGLSLPSATSTDLQLLLQQVQGEQRAAVAVAVTQAAALSMNLAAYLRAGSVPAPQWRHFALAMDHYTHFTSPIRRYPDCVVHRQLYAVLLAEGSEPGGLQWAREQGLVNLEVTPEDMDETCAHCNERKWAAKAAQEASTEVNLVAFLLRQKELKAEVVMEGLVTSMGTYTFTVLVPALNMDKQVDNRDFDEPHPQRAVRGPNGKGLRFTWDALGVRKAGRGRGRGSQGPSGGGAEKQWVVNVFDSVAVRIVADADSIPAEIKFVVLGPSQSQSDT